MGSDAISGGNFAIKIQKNWKRWLLFGDEFFDDAFRFGNIYGQYNKVFIFKFMIQFYERRELLPAPRSPCGPKEEQNHPIPVVFEIHANTCRIV